MLVGVPKEIKPQEARVGLTPGGARELIARGHSVVMETGAGLGAGFDDALYEASGVMTVASPGDIYGEADIVVKVKEPQEAEYELLRPDQVLFAYLHLAPDNTQTRALQHSGCIAIAYETVTDPVGGLPLLSPMSEVAGRLAVQAGAACLQGASGGSGLLLGGVPGVPGASVVVIGAGVVGSNAMQMAVGLGAKVTVLDTSLDRLREIDSLYRGQVNTVFSSTENLEWSVRGADLVIGAVLVPGASTPKLVARETIAGMRRGSAVADVAIDQGGCFETSRATTHAQPRYVTEGVVHYCVSNMPGDVPRTSTFALTNATLPYVLSLADLGYGKALTDDPYLRNGLNIFKGMITHPAVAASLGLEYVPSHDALATQGPFAAG